MAPKCSNCPSIPFTICIRRPSSTPLSGSALSSSWWLGRCRTVHVCIRRAALLDEWNEPTKKGSKRQLPCKLIKVRAFPSHERTHWCSLHRLNISCSSWGEWWTLRISNRQDVTSLDTGWNWYMLLLGQPTVLDRMDAVIASVKCVLWLWDIKGYYVRLWTAYRICRLCATDCWSGTHSLIKLRHFSNVQFWLCRFETPAVPWPGGGDGCW